MFSDDQLDELEQLAEQNEIGFKRIESEFSLRRGLQQAQAGFIEGLTTFDLIPKEPRNTGEAIFRQLGHLAGFAPAILKAPLAVFKKPFGKTGLYQAIESGIDTLDAMAVPMIASRGTKKLMDATLKKSGAETVDFLRKGAKTRAITEEALGLGVASAVSSIWKGSDVMADAFIGGAIAGGAFGGIGNFVSVGKMYKGTPQQIDTANKRLRAGVASMFMGIPATLRGEPTEMQIYEYLLGGFFGYNTRPAHEGAAGKWLMGKERFLRDSRDIVDPEYRADINGFGELSKKTKQYIVDEHPMPMFKNSEKLGGSNGSALGWLEHHFPETNWTQAAIKYGQKNYKDYGKDKTKDEGRSHAFYRHKAREGIEKRIIEQLEDSISNSESIYNSQQSDFTDDVALKRERVNQLSERMYADVNKEIFTDIDSFSKAVEGARKSSLGKDGEAPQVEVFIERMKNVLGDKAFKKHEQTLRKHWHSDVEPLRNVHYVEFTDKGGNTFASLRTSKNAQIGTVSIGERYHKLPLEYIGYGKGFTFLTHGVDKNGKPFKILKHRINKEGTDVIFELDPDNIKLVQDALHNEGKYIYSGVKDKDFLMTAEYVDKFGNIQLTKDMLIEALSQGDPVRAKAIRESYEKSLEVEKSVFGENSNHERKWISNIMHHAMNNKLATRDNPNLTQLHRLLGKGYGKSAADFNKRMQLLANRMTPLSGQSFKNTNPDGLMRALIIKDIPTTGESDTDGGVFVRQKFFDAGLKAIGLDPESGHYKPVLVGTTELGALATKSAGQRATDVWNKFMEQNNVDFIIFDSAAKLRGEHKTTNVEYKKSWIKANDKKVEQYDLFKKDPLEIYEFPLENLQLSTGTFENIRKSVRGEEIPIQLYGQANEIQSPEFFKDYYKEIIEPSLAGTARGRELVDAFKKTGEKDVKGFVKLMNESDLGVMEIPFEFVSDYLIKNPETKIASTFMDKLNKLDREGFFDKDFEFDANSDYSQFHSNNKILSEAMRGTYLARNVLFKNNWHNAFKKYLVRRFSNPFVEHGGKSWLKTFTPDQMMYVDIDPAKKTRNLKQGEVYLDNEFKKWAINTKYMPKKDLELILLERKSDGKQTDLVVGNERVTLGEAWMQYRRAHSKGISKTDMAKWNKTFALTVIRTPADSMSGTRVLRFRGFTGQRGAGSFTHHKDNAYLGGADKDSDSIKIFQGFSKKLNDRFRKVSDERKHWTKDGYQEKIEKEFVDKDISENELQRFKGYNLREGDKGYNANKDLEYQMFMYSPAYRHKVAQGASKGKGGLGYGLSAKIVMQNWMDFIKAKGGEYQFEFTGKDGNQYAAVIGLKDGLKYGQSRDQYFRDLGTLIVNKSADASNDPTVISYPNFRNMLFDSVFKTSVFSKKTGAEVEQYFGYKEINDWGNNSVLAAIRDAINVAKPRSRPKSIRKEKIEKFIDPFNPRNFTIDIKFKDLIGLGVGERGIVTIKDIDYNIRRVNDKNGKLSYTLNKFNVSDSMDLFDMAHSISSIKNRTFYESNQIKSSIFNLVNEMNEFGINLKNLQFPSILESYERIYNSLPIKLTKKGKLEYYSTKEINQFVNKHLDILTESMNFSSKNAINNHKNNSDIGRALDFIGKGYGNFAAIELLSKNFIEIHKALEAKGIKGDVISKLIPQITELSNKIKKSLMPKANQDKDGKLIELDALISGANKKLTELAVLNKISPKSLLDYFHTLLLSPITKEVQGKGNYPVVNHYKDIHSSEQIPFKTKRDYYQKIEELFERTRTEMEVDLKVDPVDVKKLDVEKRRNEPVLKTINEVIDSDAIELMAINDHQVKEIKKFRKNMEEHRVMSENFEQWFEYFTSVLSGGIKPREASTIKFDDIVAINKYIEGIRDPYNLEFKLKYWHLDPRFVDEKLSTKGMVKMYYQYHAPVQTAKGFKEKPIYSFTSPIGAIGNYLHKAERFITKDMSFAEKDLVPINNFLKKYTNNEQLNIMDSLFKYREEGYRPTDSKSLKELEILDKHVTTYFEKMGDKWIYTKDQYGNKISGKDGKWEMDKNFDTWYKESNGVLNKYMRWDKDGKFDHKHFRLNVIEKNLDALDVINLVGIDGIKRYQFEHKLEKRLDKKIADSKSPVDAKAFRLKERNKHKGIGLIDPALYMHHGNFGYNQGARQRMANWINAESKKIEKQAIEDGMSKAEAKELGEAWKFKMENKGMNAGEFFSLQEIMRSDVSKIEGKDLEASVDEQGSNPAPLRERTKGIDGDYMAGYDKRPTMFADYMSKVIRGYYKNATAIKGQYEIDNMLHRMKDYKVSAPEALKLKRSKYESYPEVWADYIRLYLQSILGHQSYFSKGMTSGSDPLMLKNKKNMFYLTSDENMVKSYEWLYQRNGYKPAFINNAPLDKKARIEYFSRKIHEFGRMEAQFQLMSLLANTGTWATNIFSGNAMTAGSAGVRNFFSVFSDKKIYKSLLSDANGNAVVKLNNGKYAKTRKDLLQYLQERGVIDNFIQNEFEINTDLTQGLKKIGVNVKDLQRDLTISMKQKGMGYKGEETPLEVIERYGVKDIMLKYGGFFMQHSEKVNRLNAFAAHAIQTINRYGVEGRELSIKDDFVFDMAMKGIENTQFLYQNASRPAFMRTATGKVLSRFKLFVWNSIRTRKEFYRQAKLYGFRQGTPEYERFKDTYMIDMFMFAMASAFMFSIFDTALAPPLDTLQSIADSLYGDKREKDMAFFGSKLGALNLLKPPVARIPDAAWELLTGDWEKFSSYTAYTMFPFGRGVRQLNQFIDNPKKAGEIFLRLPVNQVKNKIKRAQRRSEQEENIEELLGAA